MTDRDLLELAAKAAGLSLSDEHVWDDERAEYVRWNPLTDDGDAFRLAVKLRIDVRHSLDHVKAQAGRSYWREDNGSDSFAAARIAIVRAAAKLGRTME